MNFMPRPRAYLAWRGVVPSGVRSWKAIFVIDGVCDKRVEMALDSANLCGRGRKLYLVRINACWWAIVCIWASCCMCSSHVPVRRSIVWVCFCDQSLCLCWQRRDGGDALWCCLRVLHCLPGLGRLGELLILLLRISLLRRPR
jgi:hypothetical protein